MRPSQQKLNYKRLEELPSKARQLVISSLQNFWEDLPNLWQLPSNEPRVQQRLDGSGNVYWKVYDPKHDLTICLDDEQAVMTWLDKQTYRQPRANVWNMG